MGKRVVLSLWCAILALVAPCFCFAQQESSPITLETLLTIDPRSLSKGEKALLYSQIGGLYLSLGADAKAATYFLRAQRIVGREPLLEKKLHAVYDKLGMEVPSFSFVPLPFFRRWIFPLFFITFFLISFYIWTKVQFWAHAAWCVGTVTLGIFLFVLYHAYLIPIQGVVIHSTPVYTQQDLVGAPVVSVPLLPGQLVDVKQFSLVRKQAFIRDRRGIWGYVPADAIWLIE